MARFQHILFPTDLSQLCRTFASEVSYIARHMHASVTLLHVIEGYPHWYGSLLLDSGFTLGPEDFFVEERTVCQTAFREFEQLAGIPVEGVVEGGDPVRSICEFSKKHRVDLVMIPTHGSGYFRRILHGTVVSKLLSASPCAVWTTSHENTIAPHIPCKRIVVALGFDGEAEYLLRSASEVASELGAKLRLVHAVEGAEEKHANGRDREMYEFLMNAARRRMDELQTAANTDFESVFRAGKAADVISDSAAEWNADLVLIGRSSLHKLLGPLRSHAYDIVNAAPCCVLAV